MSVCIPILYTGHLKSLPSRHFVFQFLVLVVTSLFSVCLFSNFFFTTLEKFIVTSVFTLFSFYFYPFFFFTFPNISHPSSLFSTIIFFASSIFFISSSLPYPHLFKILFLISLFSNCSSLLP